MLFQEKKYPHVSIVLDTIRPLGWAVGTSLSLGPPWELGRIMLVPWPRTQVLDHSSKDGVRLGQLSSRPDGRRLWWDTCSHS